MRFLQKVTKIFFFAILSAWLLACGSSGGGGDGGDEPPPPEISMVGNWMVDIEGRWESVSFTIEIITQDSRGSFKGTADSQNPTGYRLIVTGWVHGSYEGNDLLQMEMGEGPPITCSTWDWLGVHYIHHPYTRYYLIDNTEIIDPDYIEARGSYRDNCGSGGDVGWRNYSFYRT